jgi:starvation-inducible DNA-binding protein
MLGTGDETPMPATTNKAIVDALSRLLADSYTVYLKTHNYHWNVTGPMFNSLHVMFEQQYTELAMAIDEIAERIRACGAYAPGSFAEFQKLSKVKDATGRPKAKAMLEALVADQAIIGEAARKLFDAAEKAKDQASADLATRRMDIHEKNAWMLRSHLE